MSALPIIVHNWKKSFALLRAHPGLLVMPFFCLALCEVGWLSLWYYAPRPPNALILAPIIKAFFGEQFLHYPLNFLILPRLVFIGRALLYLAIGPITMAMTMNAVYQTESGRRESNLFGLFNRAVRQYPRILFFAICYCFGALVVYKLPRLAVVKLLLDNPSLAIFARVAAIVSVAFLVLLEGMLIYAAPLALLAREPVISCLKKSALFFKRVFIPTLIIIIPWRLLNVVSISIKNKAPGIVENIFPEYPETILFILGGEITGFFLANVLIVILCTQLFLAEYEK